MNPSTKTSLDIGRQNSAVEDVRTGLTVESLKQALADNLYYAQGKFPTIATKNDFYMALAYTVRSHQATKPEKLTPRIRATPLR